MGVSWVRYSAFFSRLALPRDLPTCRKIGASSDAACSVADCYQKDFIFDRRDYIRILVKLVTI